MKQWLIQTSYKYYKSLERPMASQPIQFGRWLWTDKPYAVYIFYAFDMQVVILHLQKGSRAVIPNETITVAVQIKCPKLIITLPVWWNFFQAIGKWNAKNHITINAHTEFGADTVQDNAMIDRNLPEISAFIGLLSPCRILQPALDVVTQGLAPLAHIRVPR